MADGRIVVVTGGARGIGLAAAKRFAQYGDFVVLADVRGELAQQSAQEINDCGGGGAAYEFDVSQEDAVEELVESVETEHGPIEVWVNNAGILENPGRSADKDMNEHDRVWDVNYRGLYLCCRAVAPRMAERGHGCILNLASSTSFKSMPLVAYGPSKVAVKSLTEVLAAEFGPQGVRVNAVAPHATLSDEMKVRIDAGERDPEKLKADNAIPKMIMPEDVAEGIFFLCSEAAHAITGVTLPIDYGWLVGVTHKAYPK
ncbi:MAG: short-chain dehydrogenase [Alphaproteobacteria bacterium]|nr:short-chain dehydrogenase [Alphaproteobacteria bacterium]